MRGTDVRSVVRRTSASAVPVVPAAHQHSTVAAVSSLFPSFIPCLASVLTTNVCFQVVLACFGAYAGIYLTVKVLKGSPAADK